MVSVREVMPGATRRRRKARAFVLNVDWKGVGWSAPGPGRAGATAWTGLGVGLLVVGALVINDVLSERCSFVRAAPASAFACPGIGSLVAMALKPGTLLLGGLGPLSRASAPAMMLLVGSGTSSLAVHAGIPEYG